MKTALLVTATLALALTACGPKAASNVAAPIDPMAENVTLAANVELPPAIDSSKSYRCADNSVVQIDLFEGNKQANIKTDPKATPVVLKGEAGAPLTAEGGYALEMKGTNATVTLPGKAAQVCAG